MFICRVCYVLSKNSA